MINELYCSSETCLLLKEAGFPQEIGKDYDNVLCRRDPTQRWRLRTYREANSKEVEILARPSLFTAFRWLVCHKKLYVSVDFADGCWHYSLGQLNVDNELILKDVRTYSNYEQALENGIKMACKYLKSQTIPNNYPTIKQ